MTISITLWRTERWEKWEMKNQNQKRKSTNVVSKQTLSIISLEHTLSFNLPTPFFAPCVSNSSFVKTSFCKREPTECKKRNFKKAVEIVRKKYVCFFLKESTVSWNNSSNLIRFSSFERPFFRDFARETNKSDTKSNRCEKIKTNQNKQTMVFKPEQTELCAVAKFRGTTKREESNSKNARSRRLLLLFIWCFVGTMFIQELTLNIKLYNLFSHMRIKKDWKVKQEHHFQLGRNAFSRHQTEFQLPVSREEWVSENEWTCLRMKHTIFTI